jgi:DNA-binding NarL/FixJ family response regulator
LLYRCYLVTAAPEDVSPEQLVAAVRLVRSGDALLAPAITRRLIERYAVRDSQSAHPPPRPVDTDPARARGAAVAGARLSNAELATNLQLSDATVKTHVARILSKLGLRDRAQAIVVAYETGLVTPGRRTS